MNMQACLDDLLRRGADDWVDNNEVAWIAKSLGGARTPDQILEVSVQLLAEALRHGLVQIGDITPASLGFRQWGLPIDAAIERVRRQWESLRRTPLSGELFWLQSTAEGLRRGNMLLGKTQ